jgi:hypothetical protein
MLLFYQVATSLSLTTCWQIVALQNDNKLLELVTTCNKSVELNNFVASFQQAVDNLLTSWEQAVRTHPVDKLLEQHCYKSAAGLLQLVDFYVCSCIYTIGVYLRRRILGASRVKFGSAVMGGKLKSQMNTTQFLGYTWNQKNLKQESQNWIFYMFCMSLLQTFPQNFEFKRLISLEKIKIAHISIILECSQKCIID